MRPRCATGRRAEPRGLEEGRFRFFASREGPALLVPLVPFRSVPAVQIGERHSAERSGLTAPCPVEKWLGSRSCQTRPRVTGVHIAFVRPRSRACDEWRDARVSLRSTDRSHADFADFPQDSCETRGEDLRHIYRQVATYGSVLA